MHSRNRCNELSLVSAQKVYNLFLLDFFAFDIFQITTFESIYEIGRCIRLGFFFYPALALFEQANCYTNIYYIFSVTEIYFFFGTRIELWEPSCNPVYFLLTEISNEAFKGQLYNFIM